LEVDKNKAEYYYELAAVRGDVTARYNLGVKEARAGNVDRALIHDWISGDGSSESLRWGSKHYTRTDMQQKMIIPDYTTALQLYQEFLGEIKSVQRDKAAAYSDNRYY